MRFPPFLFAVSFFLSLQPTSIHAAGKEGCDKTGCLHWDFDADYQGKLREWEAAATSSELNWEWIVIRINGASGLEDADFFGRADSLVTVEAVPTSETNLPDVPFYDDSKPNEFVFPTRDNTNEPEWHRLGLVAYLQGTTQELVVTLADDEGFTGVLTDEILVQKRLSIEEQFPQMNVWKDVILEEESYALNASFYRSTSPIQTAAAQNAMNLTDEILALENDNVATLNSKKSSVNGESKSAVLYLGGRGDTFAHPHVLEMYEAKGYDFYNLDPRYCGRNVRFLNDTQYGHWIHDFDTYREELDLAVQKIQASSQYEKLLMHCHSTGCLVATNYLRQLKEESPENDPFDGYILNAPFLDWGLGGFEEFAVENSFWTAIFTGDNSMDAEGLSRSRFLNWMLYRFSPTTVRTIIESHVNNEWAGAVTTAQEKITSRDSALTDKPIFNIISKGDDTLTPSEMEDLLKYVSSNHDSIMLDNNRHDVTMSYTTELNDDALFEMGRWLDKFDTGILGFSSDDSDTPVLSTAFSKNQHIVWSVLISLISSSFMMFVVNI